VSPRTFHAPSDTLGLGPKGADTPTQDGEAPKEDSANNTHPQTVVATTCLPCIVQPPCVALPDVLNRSETGKDDVVDVEPAWRHKNHT